MKFTIKRHDLAKGLLYFAYKYINNERFISTIVELEDFKSFKDIEKAFQNYKIIKEDYIFYEQYINRVVSSYRPFDGDHTVLVKTKGKVKHVYKSSDSTLTINCSLEEYSKLDLHHIGVKNTLAFLKKEGVTEDSVLDFNTIVEMLKKYEIVNCYTYLGKKMYRNYDMISCEPYGNAVLMKHPMTEEEYKIMKMLGYEV